MPAWTSPDYWHQGWELTPAEAAYYAIQGPLQENAGQASDELGNPLFVEHPDESPELIGEGGSAPQAALASLDDTFNLHSRPNANHTIYLDFNGHVTQGTTWNSSSGRSSINSPAYDPANNGSEFTSSELTIIQNIWKRVAEDFSPFEVNVTTEDPGAAALRRSGGSDTQWGTRVVITEDWDNCGCGGFAYLNSFNDSADEPVFVFNSGEIGVSAASTHEVGHAMGLSHDGTTGGQSYYGGHGSGDTSWGPIMGSGYSANMTTWDSGDYRNANNSQDDWQIITSNNGFGYRNDDHGASNAAATPLDDLGANSSDPTLADVAGFGVIELGSDLDWFEFETGDGAVNLTIDSYVQETFISNGAVFTRSLEATAVGNQGSNLDIEARIYDSSSSVVATSNPTGGLSASFNNLNLSAGTYYLRIDGIGYGDWTQSSPTGYDQSVSRGQYAISGTVVAAQQTLNARNDSASTDVNTLADINVVGNDVNPLGGPVTITSVGAPASGQAIAAGGMITYTPNLDFIGSDSFTYTISNGIETDTATVSINVLPPVPPILFVDDDQGGSFERFYTAALDANGLSYDRWEVESNGLPSSSDLTAYSVVVWNTGYDYNASDAGFSSGEQATLATYLDSGGNLFAVGQDILYNGVSSTFQSNYLKVADYTSDVRGLNAFAGVSGNAISNGMSLNFNLPSDFSADWSDTLTPSVGAEGVFYRNNVNSNSQPYNTVGYSGADFKVVFMAAPFEGISTTAGNPNNQAAVMGKVIDFFLGGNQSPVATNNGYTMTEDRVLNTGNVLTDGTADSDPEGDSLTVITVAAVNPANGSVTLSDDGDFTYTPNADFNGTDSFVYTVSDGNGGQDTGTVSIAVTAEVDIADDIAVTDQDTPVTTSVLANDNFDGLPAVTAVTDGTNGTVTSDGTATTYLPDPSFNGSDSYTYTVTSGGVTESTTVNVTVRPVIQPPTANNDSDETDEDASVTTSVLANDTFEGSPSVTVESGDEPANGTTNVNIGGSITYTPDPEFNGTDSYIYTVTGADFTETATVTITVNQVNDPANFSGNTFGSAAEDSGNITGDLDASDAADGMTNPGFRIGDGPTSGDAAINATTGAWSYTPNPDYYGSDSFTVSVTDDDGNFETQVIRLSVTPVVDIASDSVSTAEDNSVRPGVLGNDTFSGTPIITGTTQGTNGTVTTNGTNVTYTPDPDFHGSDGYSYTVTSGGVTETATVTVTVNAVDDAADDTSSTSIDTPVSGSVTGNDTFSGAVTYVINVDGSNGTVTDNGSGGYTYTPNADFTGVDSFTYDATDVNGFIETQTVTITVQAKQADFFYFSGRNSGNVGGSLQFQNEDIVAFDGTEFRIFFDGTPWASGLTLDAFAIEKNGDILMSFSAAGSITGISLSFDDSDIVRYSPGSQNWEMYFDGSDVELTRSAEDVDAIGFAPDGRLLISTRGTARVAGVTAADEDLIAFTSSSTGPNTSGAWELYFDGSDVGLSSSSSEDVDAVSVASDGTIYISTSGNFSVSGVSGADEDVAVFDAVSLGSNTNGSFRSGLFFDGSSYGLSNDIGGMFIVDLGSPAATESQPNADLMASKLDVGTGQGSAVLASQSLAVGDNASPSSEAVQFQLGINIPLHSFDMFVSAFSSAADENLTDVVLLLWDLFAYHQAETDSLDHVFANWSNGYI